jgi:hypothetical protein
MNVAEETWVVTPCPWNSTLMRLATPGAPSTLTMAGGRPVPWPKPIPPPWHGAPSTGGPAWALSIRMMNCPPVGMPNTPVG